MLSFFLSEFAPLFLTIAGLTIGLGALTVIDWHGFLAQRSEYWTRATISAHKITKPLIWAGLIVATIGSLWLYSTQWQGWHWVHIAQVVILPSMILNGCFLSFWVSPRLLQREKEGRAEEILPASWQRAIFWSFLFSFATWWSQVGLLVYWLATQSS